MKVHWSTSDPLAFMKSRNPGNRPPLKAANLSIEIMIMSDSSPSKRVLLE